MNSIDKQSVRVCVMAIAFTIIATLSFSALGTEWVYQGSTGKGGGDAALKDLSKWVDKQSWAAGPAGQSPTSTDTLIVTNPRMRLNGDQPYAKVLQIGTGNFGQILLDGNNHTFANDGVKVLFGEFDAYYYTGAAGVVPVAFNGNLEIASTSPNAPAIFNVGSPSYINRDVTFNGAFSGGANAYAVFGPAHTAVCASNTTFNLPNFAGYSGTIMVTSSYSNVGSSFGTRLNLGASTSSAKVVVAAGGSIAAPDGNATATVNTLTLAAGSRLWIDGTDDVLDGELGKIVALGALTVTGPVEIYWNQPFLRNTHTYRIPILVGPASATFVPADFTLTFAASLYNINMHLEVESDETEGTRTLFVALSGAVEQISSYGWNAEAARTAYASSFTNSAAWWNGLVPDSANAGAIYMTKTSGETYLRTLFAPTERYVFPCAGYYLNHGYLQIQTKTFEVPELWCNGYWIATGDKRENTTSTVIAPRIHLVGERSELQLRSFAGCMLAIKGDIDGTADIYMRGWDGTGTPRCMFWLDGMNTNWSGSIRISTDAEERYVNRESQHPVLLVSDVRNLGDRRAELAPRAVTLQRMSQIKPAVGCATVTLDADRNRGVYVKGNGGFGADAGQTLDVRWPVLLSGQMWKDGEGVLVLGGAMKHEVADGGAMGDIPRAGSNLFEIVEGTVKIAHADALAGVQTTVGANTTLSLVLDPENGDLSTYGIRNVTTDTPFVLAEALGGRLPITLDASAVAAPTGGEVRTNALLTVNATAAASVRPMLSRLPRTWPEFSQRIIERTDEMTGNVTFSVVNFRCGFRLEIR